MELEEVVERVGRIAGVRASLVTRLREHTSFVESSVADAGRTSLNAAAKTTERRRWTTLGSPLLMSTR